MYRIQIKFLVPKYFLQKCCKKGGGALRSEFVIIHTKILIPTKNVEKKEGGHFVLNSNKIPRSKIFPPKNVVKKRGALRTIFTIEYYSR